MGASLRVLGVTGFRLIPCRGIMSSGRITLTNSTNELDKPLVEKPPAKNESSEAGKIFFFCILSVISSVFIAICMKEVMENGFPFPLTVSWVAYVFTWLFYVVMKATNLWQPEKEADGSDKNMPAMENIKVAV